MELEELLINARKAVDDKNWTYMEKYYNLLQEKSSDNELFYNVMALFNYKLEQLMKTYKEQYLHDLISKHKQIIMFVENERKKEYRPTAIFAFVTFLLMSIISTSIYLYFSSLCYTDDVLSGVIILPWFCTIVSGIILKKLW